MQKLVLKQNNRNGNLITFCGLDGSGKTSMIRFLTERFRQVGIEPCLTRQPTDTVRASEIFRNFMDEENHASYDYRALSLMAASDRIQHTNKVILPLLDQGETVISDRYFYSCLANLRARGYTQDQWIYEIGSKLTAPDISFFVDVPVETAVQRVHAREEEKDSYIDMQLQYRLREEYLAIARDVDGIVISTEQTEKVCYEQMLQAVEKQLGISLNGNSIDQVRENIYKLLRQYSLVGQKIEDEMDLENDLGMDSLKRTQLICDIEENFSFEFSVGDLAPDNFRKVGDVCRLTVRYVHAQA